MYDWDKFITSNIHSSNYAVKHIPQYSAKINQQMEYKVSDLEQQLGVEPEKRKRSTLDRIFDAMQIGQHSVMGGLYNLTDGDKNTGVIGGIGRGIKSSNPLGQDDKSYEKSFSDVLGNLGWNPKSLGGKIAKGTVGFVGDVVLDPLTYVTLGIAPLVKGTGKVIKTLKGTKKIGEMTPRLARHYLNEMAKKGGEKVTNEAVEDLVRRYNKLKGISPGGVDGISIGTKYVPFGKKLGLSGKNKVLVSDAKLREIGDKTIAPYFNAFLEFLRHNPITGKLNPNREIQQLIKTDPEKVVKLIKFQDYVKGQNYEKILADREVIKFAQEELNFDDDKLKLITDLLERKEMFDKISFAKTQAGMKFHKKVKDFVDKYSHIIGEPKTVKDMVNQMDEAPINTAFKSEDIIDDVVKNKPLDPSEKLDKILSENRKWNNALNNATFDQIDKAILNEIGVDPKIIKKAKDKVYLPKTLMPTKDGFIVDRETGEYFGSVSDYFTKKAFRHLERDPITNKVKYGVLSGKKEMLSGKVPMQDKIHYIERIINDTPILKHSLSNITINPKLSERTADTFIKTYFNGTISDVLAMSHRLDINYNIASKLAWKDLREIAPKWLRNARLTSEEITKMNKALDNGSYKDLPQGLKFLYMKHMKKYIVDPSLIKGEASEVIDDFVKAKPTEGIEKGAIEQSIDKANKHLEDFNAERFEANTHRKEYAGSLEDGVSTYKKGDGLHEIKDPMQYAHALAEKEYGVPYHKLSREKTITKTTKDGREFKISPKDDIDFKVKNNFEGVYEWKKYSDVPEEFAEILSRNTFGKSYNMLEGAKKSFVDRVVSKKYGTTSSDVKKVSKNVMSKEEFRAKMLEDMKPKEKIAQQADNIKAKITEDIPEVIQGNKSEDELLAKLKEYQKALEDEEAFEMLARKELGDDVVDSVKIMLDEADVDEQVKQIVKTLRQKFEDMGIKEARIGKMSYSEIMEGYVYHMLNPAKARELEKLKDTSDKKKFFTNLFGFNTRQSPFRERKFVKGYEYAPGKFLKHGTVSEINRVMKEQYGIDDFFVHEITDIYIHRAMKHNEMMYDDKVSSEMMRLFGEPLEKGMKIHEGNVGVIRGGDLQNYFKRYNQDNVAEALRELGIREDILEQFTPPFIEINQKQLELLNRKHPNMFKFQLHKSIVEKANQTSMLQFAKNENALLQAYDRFLHLWKINVTAVLPGFHARNKYSNTFQNYLALGEKAFDMELQKAAFTMLKEHKSGKRITGVLKLDNGKTMSLEEVFDLAEKYDAVNLGFFSKDLKINQGKPGVLEGLGVKGKYDPTNINEFVPYKIGRDVGSAIENHDRLINFMAHLQKGLSPKHAAEMAEKFLFNYGELSRFEEQVMKRIVPFYTWFRKNLPLQLEMMATEPQKYMPIAKFLDNVEGMTNEEDRIDKNYVADFAQDWVQLPLKVKNPEGREEPVLFNPNLPFGDVNRITPTLNPKELMRDVIPQTSPLIKVPLEQIFNRNFFFENKIDRGQKVPVPGYLDPIGHAQGKPNMMSPRLRHLLDQIGSANAIAKTIEKKGLDKALHVLNQTTGVKLSSYDYDKYKAFILYDRLNKLNQMKKEQ